MIRFKYFILIILFISSQLVHAQAFSIAKFSIGETRIPLNLNDFAIHTKSKNIKTNFINDSLQWIRNENNLLVPRILLEIQVDNSQADIYLSVDKKNIFPAKLGSTYSTKVYVDLFNPAEISVFSGTTLLDSITIEAKNNSRAKSKQLIDYSCSPYSLKIEGIDNEYISVGCKMNRLGKWYAETPRLEITMSSTNLKTATGSKPPYFFYLEDNSPIEIQLIDQDKKINIVRIEAQIPPRLHRLNTALGFGPYLYKAGINNEVTKSLFAPSLMIYGKFALTETASIKAFDALLYSKSLFNNSGLYFSYDLAEVFDNRIFINALLGFQGIHYSYKRKTSGTEFKTLYPQGFEVLFKHAFGLENYNLFYGMFLSTNQERYTNAWVRFGKSTFLELNYIDWASSSSSKIQMWGVSLGFPFISGF